MRGNRQKLKEKEKSAGKKMKDSKKGGRESDSDDDHIETALAMMLLEEDGELSDSDDAACPKCGLVYADDDDEDSLWVCCDTCNRWFDLQCTNIQNKRRVPNTFICKYCTK